MELLTLSTHEVRRLEVLQALATGALRQSEAAQILDLFRRRPPLLRRERRSRGWRLARAIQRDDAGG